LILEVIKYTSVCPCNSLMLFISLTDSCCDRSTNIQSYEGGSVSISCSYESEDQNNLKYICRGKQPSTCLQQALITSDNKRKGRFRLTDDKESRKFTVNITSLTQEDSGSYLCGVHRNTGLDVFSAAELEVKVKPQARLTSGSSLQDDVSSSSFSVTITELKADDAGTYWCGSDSQWSPGNYTKIQLLVGYEGGSVSISCSYESEDQNNLKYICRGKQPSTCLQQALITSDNTHNAQFRLTDDKESRKFTVNITSLTQEDSGSYLCGVHRNTGLDVFSAWCCVKSNILTGTMGRPLTMQCPYPPQHETNRKFLCKGDQHNNCTDMVTSQTSGQTDLRFTLQDDVSSSSFSVTITELKADDAGTYWCGSDSQWSPGNYTKIQEGEEALGNIASVIGQVEHRSEQSQEVVEGASAPGSPGALGFCPGEGASLVFTTTLSDLSSVDAGKYWCGVTRTGKDTYTEVRLEVDILLCDCCCYSNIDQDTSVCPCNSLMLFISLTDSCCDRSTNIQSYEGGSVSISCSYESEDQNNLKYICRGKQPSTCLQQALITSDNTQNAQFRLTDDKESRKFTVNITSLTQEDSGSYLCGVHRNTGLDVFSAAELEVKGQAVQITARVRLRG
uniref:Ig-like domain-containing protein n=1 Tax=Lates calcarifer TaxID=8187 RepID=A0A4W6E1U7_LATCA